MESSTLFGRFLIYNLQSVHWKSFPGEIYLFLVKWNRPDFTLWLYSNICIMCMVGILCKQSAIETKEGAIISCTHVFYDYRSVSTTNCFSKSLALLLNKWTFPVNLSRSSAHAIIHVLERWYLHVFANLTTGGGCDTAVLDLVPSLRSWLLLYPIANIRLCIIPWNSALLYINLRH